MRCFQKLLGISYRDHIQNAVATNRVREGIRPYDELLTTVKKYRLRWHGYASISLGISKIFLHGTMQSLQHSLFLHLNLFYLSNLKK